jgi:hypothetical protein
MGKTERILNNLPATFRPFPRPSALFTLVNAFGIPLQESENLLVEVMKAHWVDHADRGRETVRDLKLLAALYDLQPRPDEGVEEFREHLKRYVRTYLEGTATIQGILRLAADTLGLTIDPQALQRPQEVRVLRIDDATRMLFGVPWAKTVGRDEQPAQVVGRDDLSGGGDLRSARALKLQIDGTTKTIDVAAEAARSEAVRLGEIVEAINDAFKADFGPEVEVAKHDGQHVILTSPAAGAAGRIEFLRPDESDAADPILGIAPRVYHGADPRAAQVIGTVGLEDGADLSTNRYLRLAVDDTYLVEVDCAAGDQAPASLDDIRDRINAALRAIKQDLPDVASHDDHVLTLTSPTTSFTSSIEVQPAAANDAAERLLGPGAHGFYVGADASPAQLTGRQALNRGVDLRTERTLVLKIDDGGPVEIDCAGPTPEQTSIEEIVERINAAAGPGVADHDGVFITLSSPTSDATSRLEVLTAAEGDAADRVLGLAPRAYAGSEATPARLEGREDLRPHVDLRWRRRIALAVDDSPATEINAAGPEPQHTTPDDVATAINTKVGQALATTSEGKLILTSLTAGADSRLELLSRDRVTSACFLTRTPLLDEAAVSLFGFVEKQASGELPQPARLAGQVDLSQGVDLREQSFLRLGVDDNPPVDIDCQGDRPRVTLLEQIVEKVGAALGAGVVSDDDCHLILTSPTAGPGGRIVVEPSTATDAAEILLEVNEAMALGREATQVVFTGTRDLSLGLTIADRYLVQIGIDDKAPVEIDLRAGLVGIPELPEIPLDLFDIEECLNEALRPVVGEDVADHDGRHVIIRSPSPGSASRVSFEVPSDPDHDATADVFGVTPHREYTGTDGTSAELQGTPDLSGGINLTVRCHLRVAVDGDPPQDIDCAGENPAATTLAEVVAAINSALSLEIARDEDGHLILSSQTTGANSSLIVEPSMAADATALILGDVAGTYPGKPGTPAVLPGEVSLLGPVDLSQRGVLRIVVDGGPPMDVDVAGPTPERTFSDEVVAALNAAFPRPEGPPLAALTEEGYLQLVAERDVGLFPLRYLTLIEFPPAPATPVSVNAVHGAEWTTMNDGVDAVPLTITLTTTRGVVNPTFTNRSVAAWVRVPVVVGPGQALRLGLDEPGQPWAEINGETVSVETDPSPAALHLPAGTSHWQYTECYGSRFDQDRFDAEAARFAGGQCRVLGVFDLSHFVADPDAPEVAVFVPANGMPDTGTRVTLAWEARQPGRFELELPYDLPHKYGGRFDEARFAGPVEAQAQGLIIETESVPGSLIAWVNEASRLADAQGLDVPPPGVTPRPVPWSQPVPFEGGTAETPARLVLTEDGLDGYVELQARAVGTWGNHIQVVASEGETPGTWNVTIGYDGDDVFENARQKVQEQIILARAAGVASIVTRPVRSH